MTDTPTSRATVEKICGSEAFRRSPRIQRLLRHLLERTLEGNRKALKEYTLAVEVFDRPPTFDPRLDPIVRVEMCRLRRKLTNYYRTEGREDALVFRVPKGGYAAELRDRWATRKPAGKVCSQEQLMERIARIAEQIEELSVELGELKRNMEAPAQVGTAAAGTAA